MRLILFIFNFFNDNLECIKYFITATLEFVAFPLCRASRTRFKCGVILIIACLILSFSSFFKY